MPTPDVQQRRNFPRGLVLGLTMAETMVIVVFVLLLAMTELLGRDTDDRREAEAHRRQTEASLQEMQEMLAEHGYDQEGIAAFKDQVAADRTQAENWEELVRGLGPDAPNISPDTMASRLREARDISEALTAGGVDTTPEALREMAEVVRTAQDAGVPADDLRDAIHVRDELADAWDDEADGPGEPTTRALADIVRDARSWRAQHPGGGGSDHPSCWYDDDGTVAYLFDVALRDDGYVLQPARAPQHAQARERLPDDDIRTGQVLDAAQFLAQTRGVFDWSVANDCRFFVRAFDLTGASSKEIYKTRMRTLEERFYKYATPTGPAPEVDGEGG